MFKPFDLLSKKDIFKSLENSGASLIKLFAVTRVILTHVDGESYVVVCSEVEKQRVGFVQFFVVQALVVVQGTTS